MPQSSFPWEQVAEASQEIAAATSTLGAVLEVTLTAVGCAEGPEGCLAGYMIANGMYQVLLNPLETAFSVASTLATVAADRARGLTYYEKATATLVIGEASTTSLLATLAGNQVRMGVLDAAIDLYMVQYNAGRVPGVTLPSFAPVLPGRP